MHTDFNLLEKTELTIAPISLSGANLDAVARESARVLGLDPDDVYVIDAIGEVLTLDILRETHRGLPDYWREKETRPTVPSP